MSKYFAASQLSCNQQEHSDQWVTSICTRRECTNNSAVCSKCMIKFHSSCHEAIIFLDEVYSQIEKMLIDCELIENIFDSLFHQLSKMQKKHQIRRKIIQEYQAEPKMTNLNKIGQIFRTHNNINLEEIIQGNEYIAELIQKHLNPENQQQNNFKKIQMQKLEQTTIHIQNVSEDLDLTCITENDFINKCQALLKLQKFQECIQFCDAALKKMPNSIKLLLIKSNALNKMKQQQEALKCFEKILKIDQNNYSALFNKGLVLCEMKQQEEALKCFEKILKFDPNNLEILCNKGLVLHEMGQYEEALKYFETVLKFDQNNQAALSNKGTDMSLFQGLVLHKMGQFDEAIQFYNATLQINPYFGLVLINKGNSLYSLNQYEQAIHCFDEALKINPNSFDAFFSKGLSLSVLKKPLEAIECYDKAELLEPNNDQVLMNKGNIKFNYQCYDRAIKLNPMNTSIYLNKGLALSHLHQFQQSIECLNIALQINPNDDEILFLKGNALYFLDKFQEAIDLYDQSNFIKPKFYAYYQKGLSLHKLNRLNEAEECFKGALKLNPQFQKAKNMLYRVQGKQIGR